MKYFTSIKTLPNFKNLYDEMNTIINDYDLETKYLQHNQICLNSPPSHENDVFYGTGSLIHDWSKSIESEASGITLPARTDQLKEEDFTNLCTVFKNTIFEVVYNSIIERYKVGRVRLMMSRPKTCLSWHTDSSIRLHYPIKTQPECFMVIDDEVMHLQLNDWIMADTRQPHTAFNGSLENRVHLVAVILGENNE